MKIRLSSIKISLIVIIFFLGIGIYYIAILSRETIKWNLDDTITPLETKILSIKDGLDVAEKRAKLIDKNVKLTQIYAKYDGYEQILHNTGRIGFDFSLRNNNFNTMLTGRGYDIEIEIDLGMNAITKFYTVGPAPELGKDEPIDIINAKIDINDIFNIIKKKYGDDVFSKHPSTGAYIAYNNDFWYYNIHGENNKSLNGRIDPFTGEIVEANDE